MNQGQCIWLGNNRTTIPKPTIDCAPGGVFDFTSIWTPFDDKTQFDQPSKWYNGFNSLFSKDSSRKGVLFQFHRPMCQFNQNSFRGFQFLRSSPTECICCTTIQETSRPIRGHNPFHFHRFVAWFQRFQQGGSISDDPRHIFRVSTIFTSIRTFRRFTSKRHICRCGSIWGFFRAFLDTRTLSLLFGGPLTLTFGGLGNLFWGIIFGVPIPFFHWAVSPWMSNTRTIKTSTTFGIQLSMMKLAWITPRAPSFGHPILTWIFFLSLGLPIIPILWQPWRPINTQCSSFHSCPRFSPSTKRQVLSFSLKMLGVAKNHCSVRLAVKVELLAHRIQSVGNLRRFLAKAVGAFGKGT